MPRVRNPFASRARQKLAPPLAPESPGPAMMRESNPQSQQTQAGDRAKQAAENGDLVPVQQHLLAAVINQNRPRTAQDALRLLKRRHPKLMRKSKSRQALRNRTNQKGVSVINGGVANENINKANTLAANICSAHTQPCDARGQDVEFVARACSLPALHSRCPRGSQTACQHLCDNRISRRLSKCYGPAPCQGGRGSLSTTAGGARSS